MVSVEARNYLEKFYNKLFDNLVLTHKSLIQNSVMLTILEKQATKTTPALAVSTIEAHTLPTSIQDELLNENLIMETNVLGKFAITSKGVWLIETSKRQISEAILLDFFQKKYFRNVSLSAKPLTEKEKVVIMTMLAGRAFSEEWPVNLTLSEQTKDAWFRILQDSCSILRELNLIQDTKLDDFTPKKSLEHPILDVFRHMNTLSAKTKGVYNTIGDRKYFLRMGDAMLDTEKLKYLFQLIIGNHKLTNTDINKICSFFETAFTKENIFLGDSPEQSPFFGHTIGKKIRNALILYETH